MRLCTRCDETKDDSEFYTEGGKICKKCKSKSVRANQQAKPEKYLEWFKAYHAANRRGAKILTRQQEPVQLKVPKFDPKVFEDERLFQVELDRIEQRIKNTQYLMSFPKIVNLPKGRV